MKQLFTFCCLVFLSLQSFSQSTLFSHHEYVGSSGDTLQYRQLLSDYKQGAKYPLVIFLHGSGERGSDNEAQLKWGVHNFASDDIMKTYMPMVLAPQCPANQTWADYTSKTFKSAPTKPMAVLIELIEHAIKTLPVDPNRVYITGLSMGGFGTFDILARRPDLFAAAVPVCGGGDPNTVDKISKIPMWIFHGAEDDAVPAKLSQDMFVALEKKGAKPGFTQYPEAGHFSWVAAYSDSMMMHWLFRQKKN